MPKMSRLRRGATASETVDRMFGLAERGRTGRGRVPGCRVVAELGVAERQDEHFECDAGEVVGRGDARVGVDVR